MMRRKIGKLMLSLGVTVALGAASSTVALAENHDMGNGYTAAATLDMNNSQAAAVSKALPSCEYSFAEVHFTYGFGTVSYTVSNSDSRSYAPVTVVANSNLYGSVGLSAWSRHRIVANSNSWEITLRR